MITIMTITKSAIIMMTVDENYISNKNHQNLEVKKKDFSNETLLVRTLYERILPGVSKPRGRRGITPKTTPRPQQNLKNSRCQPQELALQFLR